jgi:hypothetical protein
LFISGTHFSFLFCRISKEDVIPFMLSNLEQFCAVFLRDEVSWKQEECEKTQAAKTCESGPIKWPGQQCGHASSSFWHQKTVFGAQIIIQILSTLFCDEVFTSGTKIYCIFSEAAW